MKHLFHSRHLGLSESEINKLLNTFNHSNIDDFTKEVLPDSIQKPFDEDVEPMSETEATEYVSDILRSNKVFKSYIGEGYYQTITPNVIKRKILNNPNWYTAYTPYQAEISQGRLEALINYQTLVLELTKLSISNASLLDESTALSEAVTMAIRVNSRNKVKRKIFVSSNIFQQHLNVLKTRLSAFEYELEIGSPESFVPNEEYIACIFQNPDNLGNISDLSELISKAKEFNVKTILATDLLSLCILKAPGDIGFDIVVGNTQRFGVPLFYGGPHAAFIACSEDLKRHLPGRIIGVSKDRNDKQAYRMSLQTREQHIRRETATSNICTSQVLLAVMAGMYAVYHGPKGLTDIANKIHALATLLDHLTSSFEVDQINEFYFDTLTFKSSKSIVSKIHELAIKRSINFRIINDTHFGISLDESTTFDDVSEILEIFSIATNKKVTISAEFQNISPKLSKKLCRDDKFLEQTVFNSYQTETKLMRYIQSLENKDISLTHSMIPLGSCTMKLNSATSLSLLTDPKISNIHPFVPTNQVKGYHDMINLLSDQLCTITGFDGCSMQPNSGAQGEYAGLMTIRSYFKKLQQNRNYVIIPTSAHGTNPASAVMAGFTVLPVKCDSLGCIDFDELESLFTKYPTEIAALMITYPSTHGVFESDPKKYCDLAHKYGAQVYLDGANLNALVGLSTPNQIGADVCHINLHKTFSIPHGGGGPGMGPICVTKHLAEHLPTHHINDKDFDYSVSAAPFGSAAILTIPLLYNLMLGTDGLTKSSQVAILNANYIKTKLEPFYPILYQSENGYVAHEVIIDCRKFKQTSNIEVEDIAKRLIDYGFHAPTMSWPVAGTLMIEPTESEDIKEIDRFCDAMISIYNEIIKIDSKEYDKLNNPLKNAPHSMDDLLSDNFEFPYKRSVAFCSDFKKPNYLPPVSRVDNAYGDRNLFCTCVEVEAYTT